MISRPGSRGFTFVELLVAGSIILLIFTVVMSVMTAGQGAQQESQGMTSLTGDMLTISKQLRKDVKATALGSVALHQNPPSCSMASVGESEQTNQFAAPNWKNYVSYVLQSEGDGKARLVRWTNAQDKPFTYPRPSLARPWEVPSNAHQKVLLKSMLDQNWAVVKEEPEVRRVYMPGAPGGFMPRFVRITADGSRDTSLENPASFSDVRRPGWSQGNTSLLVFRLTVLSTEQKKQNSLQFEIKVSPRNG